MTHVFANACGGLRAEEHGRAPNYTCGAGTADARTRDRLTPAEKLDRAVTSLGPTRGSLIGKGMVWSPNHGDTAFTVPLFDEFMHRIMPGGDWRE